MGFITYDRLYSTLTFQSKSGKFFKYEIYQTSDATNLLACISSLEEIQQGVKAWIVLDPRYLLSSAYHHPELAPDEVKKHFENTHSQK